MFWQHLWVRRLPGCVIHAVQDCSGDMVQPALVFAWIGFDVDRNVVSLRADGLSGEDLESHG